MESSQRTYDLDVPVHAAYEQWTHFEDFPYFMDGVEEVRRIDDTHLHWRASIGDAPQEWDSVITRQVPDQMIAWQSTSGISNAGHVRFEPLGSDRARITLRLDIDAQGLAGKTGDATAVIAQSIERTLSEFKDFVEMRGRETGAWRGDIPGGGGK